MIDVDGVLADFVLAWTQIAVDLGFIEKPVKWNEHKSFDLTYLGITEKQIRQVWSVADGMRWFWLDFPPPIIKREVISELDALATFNETYFVTARYGGHPVVQYQTKLWLKAYGIFNANVITSGNKGKLAKALGITHSIEDKAENANLICGKSFLIDRIYNQQNRSDRLIIIKTVDEFINEVKKDGACGTYKN